MHHVLLNVILDSFGIRDFAGYICSQQWTPWASNVHDIVMEQEITSAHLSVWPTWLGIYSCMHVHAVFKYSSFSPDTCMQLLHEGQLNILSSWKFNIQTFTIQRFQLQYFHHTIKPQNQEHSCCMLYISSQVISQCSNKKVSWNLGMRLCY